MRWRLPGLTSLGQDCSRAVQHVCQFRLRSNRAELAGGGKFAGSGGAIIGVYRYEAMFKEICDRMTEIGSKTIKPIVTE